MSSQVILNLLNRFIAHLRYKGPQEFLNQVPPSFSQEIHAKTFEGEASLSIICGVEQESVSIPLYIASSGWSIYVSRITPCPWTVVSVNLLSASYVGAIAVGEVFKLLIRDYIPIDIQDHYAIDLISLQPCDAPIISPSLPPYLDLDLILVGCGAVGQAICFALNQLELRGRITLIDPDPIDHSNLQRYFLAFPENVGKSKPLLLSEFLTTQKNLFLTVREYNLAYEVAITRHQELARMETVLVSVDNKRTRINLQAILPRVIWNLWTDTQKNQLRYGIGYHTLSGPYQCLACAYYPTTTIPTQLELNAVVLGITPDQVQQAINSNRAITEEDLKYVFDHFTIAPPNQNRLRSLIGQPFSELFHGQCGLFMVPLREEHAHTPAPHIPALAGIYGVIQYVLSRLDTSKNHSLLSVAEFNGLTYPTSLNFLKKYKQPHCICTDPIYLKIFQEKWDNIL